MSWRWHGSRHKSAFEAQEEMLSQLPLADESLEAGRSGHMGRDHKQHKSDRLMALQHAEGLKGVKIA